MEDNPNSHDPREAKLEVREHRQRAYKSGILSYENHSITVACVVANLTFQGAKLSVEKGSLVPNRFFLTIPMDSTRVECEIRWRSGSSIGVSFIGDIEPDRRNARKQSVDSEFVGIKHKPENFT